VIYLKAEISSAVLLIHCKKRLVTSRLGTGTELTFFYSVPGLRLSTCTGLAAGVAGQADHAGHVGEPVVASWAGWPAAAPFQQH